MRRPWVLFIAPMVAAIFPALIPIIAIVVLWQALKGSGERLEEHRARFEAELRHRMPLDEALAHFQASRGSLPIYDHERPEPTTALPTLTDCCALCSAPILLTRDRWRHVVAADDCWEPAIPTREENVI